MGKAPRPLLEEKPKYEIKPAQNLNRYRVMFSPSGKYFALTADKNLQVYDAQTGEKKFELPNFGMPNGWLTDDIVYKSSNSTKLEMFEVATGKPLYQETVVYKSYTYTPSTSYDSTDYALPVTEVEDETHIITHPEGRIFLTYSNQYVKVFDVHTGELLQTLVSPPMDYSKKKPRLSDKPLVSEAAWSADGRSLYIISADARTISLWRLLGN
jgi:WD40 repeat protein